MLIRLRRTDLYISSLFYEWRSIVFPNLRRVYNDKKIISNI